MEELKVNEEVTTGPGGGDVEVEVTTGPGGGDVEVSIRATVDVSITVAAHVNRYRSDNGLVDWECIGLTETEADYRS